MNFHILTLFPDMVMDGLGTSITGRAMESGAIQAEAVVPPLKPPSQSNLHDPSGPAV